MRDHRKLRAFELADRLAIAVCQHTRSFPREEQFGLTALLRRGAVSAASNIVEGCARSSEADYLRSLDIAWYPNPEFPPSFIEVWEDPPGGRRELGRPMNPGTPSGAEPVARRGPRRRLWIIAPTGSVGTSGFGFQGSTREVESQLSLAARLGYLEAGPNDELSALAVETGKVIAGLVRSLRV